MAKFLTINLAFAGLLVSTAAWAVDRPSSGELPDFTNIRAEIKAQDRKTVITGSEVLVDKDFQDPNVYNLLGFSLPKSGDSNIRDEFYTQNGDIPKAQLNFARLKKLCPNGC